MAAIKVVQASAIVVQYLVDFPESDARLSQRDAELASTKRQLSQQAAGLDCTYDKLADKAAELDRIQQQRRQLSMG